MHLALICSTLLSFLNSREILTALKPWNRKPDRQQLVVVDEIQKVPALLMKFIV